MFRTLSKMVRSPRPVDRKSILSALQYALQAVLCSLVVFYVYRQFNLGSPMWAVVSAVLVLQPGLEQSYGASATRFVSNLIGALTGAGVDKLHGHGLPDVLVALVLVVGFCEILRLDQGLRSACASVVIVMMSSVGDTVVAHATERRVLAVVIGCSTALLICVATERLRKLLRLDFHPPVSAHPTQVDEG